jgi:hypothetical protein
MMRRSLELGMVVIVLLLAVIISLAVQKSSNSSDTDLLKSIPQSCGAGSPSPRCWTVTAAPREGVTQKALTGFLSTVWNTNGAGTTSVFGAYELQRCANAGIGSDNVVCTLWSTGAKSDTRALESQFLNSRLFVSVAATHS